MFNFRMLIPAVLMMASLAANAQAPAASAPAAPAPAASAPAASAPATADPAAKFAARKEKALARIAAHLQALQAQQSCVQAATDRAGMKACRKAARSDRKHHHN
jgi:hypothetical protein